MDEELPQLPAATGGPYVANPAASAAPPGPTAAELQEGLDDKQSEALVALLHEPTIARAATLVGVHERTLRRWMNEPTFKQAYGTMLGGIGAGALLGALVIGKVPAYYPRHHLIPLSMCLACCCMLAFSLTTTPWMGFPILVGTGFFWMLSLNSANAANQLLATEENRGRVLSVMLLCNQGFMPLGHLFAALLTRWLSPQWVIRSMVGTLLLVMLYFLMKREAAIDAMLPRPPRATGVWQAVYEAITAQSHRPVPPPMREELAEVKSAEGERMG